MREAKRSERGRTVSDLRPLEGEIRQRAYELYEARGREDGHELDDWLQAEAEILGTRQRVTAA